MCSGGLRPRQGAGRGRTPGGVVSPPSDPVSRSRTAPFEGDAAPMLTDVYAGTDGASSWETLLRRSGTRPLADARDAFEPARMSLGPRNGIRGWGDHAAWPSETSQNHRASPRTPQVPPGLQGFPRAGDLIAQQPRPSQAKTAQADSSPSTTAPAKYGPRVGYVSLIASASSA